jgi:hypothetical protein
MALQPVAVPVEPSLQPLQLTAWLEHPDGRRCPVFAWARMGTAALLRTAAEAGLRVMDQWRHADRIYIRAATPAPRQAERLQARSQTWMADS